MGERETEGGGREEGRKGGSEIEEESGGEREEGRVGGGRRHREGGRREREVSFCSAGTLSGMDKSRPPWGGPSALPSLPIPILVSSANPRFPPNTPRNNA